MTENDFGQIRQDNFYAVRRLIQKFVAKVLPREILTKFYYWVVLRKRVDLNSPRTFNEKIQWYKLYFCPYNNLAVQCSDKYAVREYLIQNDCKECLNPILGVWDSTDEVRWDELPNKFALKCNHGCGYNIICRDKNHFDISRAEHLLEKWMKDDFGLYNIEPHYDKISRKIICEEFIETANGDMPIDYKVYCFDGKPKLILVCTEREENLRLSFFDTEWNVVNIGEMEPDYQLKKPQLLSEALEICEKLSKSFPFVRVDLYDCENRIIFGELSFTPAAGMANYYNEDGDMYVGNLFNLPL